MNLQLISTRSGDARVELQYPPAAGPELVRLVSEESVCCGGAGVNFDLHSTDEVIIVTVRAVKDGAPARTVLDAFAAMG